METGAVEPRRARRAPRLSLLAHRRTGNDGVILRSSSSSSRHLHTIYAPSQCNPPKEQRGGLGGGGGGGEGAHGKTYRQLSLHAVFTGSHQINGGTKTPTPSQFSHTNTILEHESPNTSIVTIVVFAILLHSVVG